jgi:exonuclease III
MKRSGTGTLFGRLRIRLRVWTAGWLLVGVLASSVPSALADQAVINRYSQARDILWQQIYGSGGADLYCGFPIERGERFNVEHVFARSWMRDFLNCGSRTACERNSARYRRMEADLHNLYPAFQPANEQRADHAFAEIPGEQSSITDCDFEIARVGGGQPERVVEPREPAKGEIARAILYMQQEYAIPPRQNLQSLLEEWNSEDPPDAEEQRRNDLIASIQGTRNTFIDEADGGNPPTFPGGGYKIATWNIGWLTERAVEINADFRSRGERGDVFQRQPADFERLKRYVERLNPDIIALQEIDTVEAAQRIFDPALYDIVLTDETDFQRPGFAIRKGISFTQNPDLAELDVTAGEPRSLRRGKDVTVRIGDRSVRLLAVHLKSGCQPVGSTSDACDLLEEQIPVLDRWIDQRQAEGGDYAVLGDFNRRFAAEDPLWGALDDGPETLVRITREHRSSCWGGRFPQFIDHIVMNRYRTIPHGWAFRP